MGDKFGWALVQEEPDFNVVGVFANKSDLEDYFRGHLLYSLIEDHGTNYEFRSKDVGDEVGCMYLYTITFYDYDLEYKFLSCHTRISKGVYD